MVLSLDSGLVLTENMRCINHLAPMNCKEMLNMKSTCRISSCKAIVPSLWRCSIVVHVPRVKYVTSSSFSQKAENRDKSGYSSRAEELKLLLILDV